MANVMSPAIRVVKDICIGECDQPSGGRDMQTFCVAVFSLYSILAEGGGDAHASDGIERSEFPKIG